MLTKIFRISLSIHFKIIFPILNQSLFFILWEIFISFATILLLFLFLLQTDVELFEFKKDFKELKDREIKNRKEIESLSTKPINISLADIDEFEEKEMMKKRLIRKNIWYN